MQEQLLSSVSRHDEEDDHGLSFPAGTPFKGVVRSKDFINGLQLASAIGLTAGVPMSANPGWLHFIEDNGYEIYIAKKPLRNKLFWTDINNAQKSKSVVINEREFNVQFMSGAIADPTGITTADPGGDWNRYLYNVYGGVRAGELAGKLNWGPYTEAMLGIQVGTVTDVPGVGSWCKEAVSGVTGGYLSRGRYPQGGVPNIAAMWYGRQSDVEAAVGFVYGWRPMLVLKGTSPPVEVTPFKGEVAQADFITFANLLATVQTSTSKVLNGTAINQTEPWLKFEWNGKTLYTPKKQIRQSVQKTELTAMGIVAGSTTVVIAGKTYKVRLMTGNLNDVSSEWNNLIYRIYSGSENAANKGTWAKYTATDLGLEPGTSGGKLAHCQGTYSGGFPDLTRGGYSGGGVVGEWYQAAATNPGYGWRPLLELVE